MDIYVLSGQLYQEIRSYDNACIFMLMSCKNCLWDMAVANKSKEIHYVWWMSQPIY